VVIPQIVIDTNVLVSAVRSLRGASQRLLRLADKGRFEVNLSVPLVIEYEDACKRLVGEIDLTEQDVDDIVDFLCRIGNHRTIFYLWRPCLQDPKDDMILELAVAAEGADIITFNQRDFRGAEQFGIRVRTPREFLDDLGA
jgi:predicted nucleic acid-binding protein